MQGGEGIHYAFNICTALDKTNDHAKRQVQPPVNKSHPAPSKSSLEFLEKVRMLQAFKTSEGYNLFCGEASSLSSLDNSARGGGSEESTSL